jgi:hypothetical protein
MAAARLLTWSNSNIHLVCAIELVTAGTDCTLESVRFPLLQAGHVDKSVSLKQN